MPQWERVCVSADLTRLPSCHLPIATTSGKPANVAANFLGQSVAHALQFLGKFLETLGSGWVVLGWLVSFLGPNTS